MVGPGHVGYCFDREALALVAAAAFTLAIAMPASVPTWADTAAETKNEATQSFAKQLAAANSRDEVVNILVATSVTRDRAMSALKLAQQALSGPLPQEPSLPDLSELPVDVVFYTPAQIEELRSQLVDQIALGEVSPDAIKQLDQLSGYNKAREETLEARKVEIDRRAKVLPVLQQIEAPIFNSSDFCDTVLTFVDNTKKERSSYLDSNWGHWPAGEIAGGAKHHRDRLCGATTSVAGLRLPIDCKIWRAQPREPIASHRGLGGIAAVTGLPPTPA